MVLSALASAGADLREPRHVIYFCYFADEQRANGAAAAASESLAAAGYVVHVDAPSSADEPSPLPWTLRCEHPSLVLNRDTVMRDKQLFDDWAARWEGVYDGWEASV